MSSTCAQYHVPRGLYQCEWNRETDRQRITARKNPARRMGEGKSRSE